MKKVLSVLVLLVAAIATYNVSAQSLIGTWAGSEEDLGDGAYLTPGLMFENDGTGVFVMIVEGAFEEDGVSVNLNVAAGIPFTWRKNGNKINIATDESELYVEVQDVEISTGVPEVDKELKQYEKEMADALVSEFEPELRKELLDLDCEWIIKKLNNSTLIIEEGDDYMSFTRIE